MKDDPYRIAARANAAAREAGQVKVVQPTRADELPHSELYERPRGLRRFVFGIRKIATVNSALRRVTEQQ